MLTVILLTAVVTATVSCFFCLLVVVAAAMESGYPDDSFRPAPGKKWPRITPRTFLAVLRGRA